MSITATELKNNLGKYLMLAATEDIFITKNGKVVAKLSNPHQDRVDMAKSLFGILPADITLEEAKTERFNQIWELSLTPVWSWMRSDMDGIVTRNTEDYKKAPLSVYAPSDFVKLLTEETNSDREDWSFSRCRLSGGICFFLPYRSCPWEETEFNFSASEITLPERKESLTQPHNKVSTTPNLTAVGIWSLPPIHTRFNIACQSLPHLLTLFSQKTIINHNHCEKEVQNAHSTEFLPRPLL